MKLLCYYGPRALAIWRNLETASGELRWKTLLVQLEGGRRGLVSGSIGNR